MHYINNSSFRQYNILRITKFTDSFLQTFCYFFNLKQAFYN